MRGPTNGGRSLLDNFEHLLGAVPEVTELLHGCPGLKILVTSRSALRIQGEREYEVEPLPLPNAEALRSLGELLSVESVALFLQAARDRDPAFTLDDANARAVAEICVRLDGLPLAIRLAAARLRTFSDPNVLLERLEVPLPILNLGDRDAPARHQTMRDAIRWSYDLLDDEAQKRFRWLSAFPGGFTEDAAHFFVERSDAHVVTILDALDELVDTSLVSVALGWDHNPRFRMLQTIREFGLEQLKEQGEFEAAERAMAEYFRDHIYELARRYGGRPHRDWMEELDNEIENLRASLSVARNRAEWELFVRLVWNLWRFWNVRGYVSEGRAWLGDAMAHLTGLPVHIWHDVIVGAASLARRQQDYDKARGLLESVLVEQRVSGDIELVVSTLLELSSIASSQSNYEEAVSLLNEAKELASDAGYRLGILQAEAGLGTLEVNRQHFANGRQILERVLMEIKALGEHVDDAAIMTCLTHIGRAAQAQGHLPAAIAATRESLTLKEELGETRGRVNTLVSLARMLSLNGDIDEAESLRAEALETALQLEVPADVAEAKLEAGRFNFSWPEDRRRRLLHESLQLFQVLEEPKGITEALEGLANLDLTSEPRRAIKAFGAVDHLRATIPYMLMESDAIRRRQQLVFLRDLVGDTVFEETWRAGQEQSLANTLQEFQSNPG